MPDEPRLPTKLRLANALLDAGAPANMVERARDGFYDDIESPLDFPAHRLVADCESRGFMALAEAVKRGEYDCKAWEWKEHIANNRRHREE